MVRELDNTNLKVYLPQVHVAITEIFSPKGLDSAEGNVSNGQV